MYSTNKNGSSTVTLSKKPQNKPYWMNKSKEEIEQEKKTRVEKILSDFKNLKPEELKDLVIHQYVEKLGAPCENWSLLNRLIVQVNNTSDARTWKAWTLINRKVKSGEKAFYVIAPVLKQITELKPESKNKKILKPEDYNTFSIIIGFRLQPEFKLEQTEGEPVKYPNEPNELPPLSEVAERLGVSISWSKFAGFKYGSYSKNRKHIELNVYDWNTYFHELSHAIHDHIVKGKLKGGQDVNQETVAEFCAVVLADLYGIDTRKSSIEYISHYADKDQEKAILNIEKNMALIEKILNYALGIKKIKVVPQ